MHEDWQAQWLERLREHIEGAPEAALGGAQELPLWHYLDPEHAAAERAVLFRAYPLPLAHVSQLAAPGSFVTHDVAGVPILIVRGRDGELRAFLNVCRHRGSRLVSAAQGRGKGFVCGYHGWAYDLAGTLIHVPHREAFGDLSCEGLVELAVSVTAGIVWVTPSPNPQPALDASLGPFADELEAFGLAHHRVHKSVDETRACNWKLVLEAFQEGYHVRTLHRDSVYRFFLDRPPVTNTEGPHVRSVGARRSIHELADLPRDQWRVLDHATVFYFLFPNTVLVMHPDWCSVISMFPEATDRSRYVHRMLVPEETTRDDAYWDRTWGLIEEKVFQAEDLPAAESIQAGMRSGADTHFRLGAMEYPIAHFHASIDRALAPSPSGI